MGSSPRCCQQCLVLSLTASSHEVKTRFCRVLSESSMLAIWQMGTVCPSRSAGVGQCQTYMSPRVQFLHCKKLSLPTQRQGPAVLQNLSIAEIESTKQYPAIAMQVLFPGFLFFTKAALSSCFQTSVYKNALSVNSSFHFSYAMTPQ